MLLNTFILLAVGASFVAAQTTDSAHTKRDSIGTYEASTIVIERSREHTIITPIVATADLRAAERLAASSSLSQTLPLLHSSFDVRSYGTLGGISLPSFRGLPSEYIVVYRNGIRLTNSQNALTDLERYTSRSSSRVSLLSSTESAMYTSGVGGAAVLIQSEPVVDRPKYAAGISFQSYNDAKSLNDKEYYFKGSQPIGASSITFSGNYRATNGAFPFYQRSTGLFIDRENNDAYLALAEVEPVITLSDEATLSGLFTFSEAERGVPGPNTVDFEGASTPQTRQYDKDWLAGLFYRSQVLNNYFHELSFSYQWQLETYRDPIRTIDDAYRNRMLGATYVGKLVASEDLVLMSTAGYGRDMLESNQHKAENEIFRDRYHASLAGKYFLLSSLSMTASLRAERVSDIDGIQILPAVCAGYQAGQFEFSGSLSKFYHAPTFNELYWIVGGDSTLRPESGMSYEIRSTYNIQLRTGSTLALQGALFLTDIRDQIIWTPESGGFSIPVQMQRVRTQGVELDTRMEHALSQEHTLKFRFAVTVLDKVNLVESSLYYGKELPYSAPLRLTGIAEDEWKGVGALSVLVWHHGRQYSDFANNLRAALPSVTTFDIHLRLAPIQLGGVAFASQLSAINLTNKQYEDVLSYPLPGRIFKLNFDFTYDTN